jgi:hypothetical protein
MRLNPEETMSMKFLILNTDYPRFLHWLYAQHPGRGSMRKDVDGRKSSIRRWTRQVDGYIKKKH